ncbi:MAG TPA: translation elongation factor Ts [Bacteroidota bacterium]|nr:translation elongation factor Ts [Bacteroidota bacterium]
MAITSEIVKKLRDKTGAGMMDCKKALEATNGDMEAAVDYLRKKGAATAEKRADRVANQGMVVAKISDDRKKGAIVEVNCETDFVARGEDFSNFATKIADIVYSNTPASLEALNDLAYEDGKKVSEMLSELTGKIGEKLQIKQFDVINAKAGFLESYIHMGAKIGVLLELNADNTTDNVRLARDIAMQVAAMSPIVVSRDQVSKETIDRETEIYRTQAKNEGKPDAIADKIATGRLEKFYAEFVLLEQSFIKDAGKSIKDLLAPNVTIQQFKRYQLGA